MTGPAFWFTLAAGAAIAGPICWAIGRFGQTGAIERLVRLLAGDDVDELEASVASHPAAVMPSHRLTAEEREELVAKLEAAYRVPRGVWTTADQTDEPLPPVGGVTVIRRESR